LTPINEALVPDIDLVLEEQFQELGVGEPMGFGLLQTQLQSLKQTG
jgi:hypothetical protein